MVDPKDSHFVWLSHLFIHVLELVHRSPLLQPQSLGISYVYIVVCRQCDALVHARLVSKDLQS